MHWQTRVAFETLEQDLRSRADEIEATHDFSPGARARVNDIAAKAEMLVSRTMADSIKRILGGKDQ